MPNTYYEFEEFTDYRKNVNDATIASICTLLKSVKSSPLLYVHVEDVDNTESVISRWLDIENNSQIVLESQ